MLFLSIALILMTQATASEDVAQCRDLATVNAFGGKEVSLRVSAVQAGVHDSIEVHQDGCATLNYVVVYGGGEALLDMRLHVGRSDLTAHAEIVGVIELVPTPPGEDQQIALRLVRNTRLWVEPQLPKVPGEG